MRGIGGVLVALGAILVLARVGEHGGWTSFELTLMAAVPCVGLFGLALAGSGGASREPAEPWRALLLISSIVLAPIALFLFLHWAGANTKHLLYDAAVLLATAALAITGASRTRAPYAILLAGLALLGVWMLLWIKLLGHPSASTVRVLLLCGGAVLLAAGAAAGTAGRRGADELATAGAIGAVAAGLTGIFVGLAGIVAGAFNGLITTSGSSSSSGVLEETVPAQPGGGPRLGAPGPGHHASSAFVELHHLHISGGQTSGWNLLLLAVSLGLVWLAARSHNRGVGYVGAVGLLGFLYSAGSQLTRLEAGHRVSHTVQGWPLVLLIVGVVALAGPVLRRRIG
jgi:hypothetical protein